MNAREERRFAWQTRMYERKLARGRKLDYQVAPKKLIALEDILNDMISTLDAATKKYESVISKFGGHKYKKWDKISQLLVDYLKQKAKDSVYKLSKTEAKEDAIKLMEEVAIPEARLGSVNIHLNFQWYETKNRYCDCFKCGTRNSHL